MTSTPSHTINHTELAGIDKGLQLGRTHLLTDSACSLRLIQGHMNYPNKYRHHIHHGIIESITNTVRSRLTFGIRTHLGKVKAHNHSIGNDLADALANLVADGNPHDAPYTICSYLSIGTWTSPYTFMSQTLGGPTPYRYTNLKTDTHKYSTKHTYISLSTTPPNAVPCSPAPRRTEHTPLCTENTQRFGWTVSPPGEN
jgi:hypothetical protein